MSKDSTGPNALERADKIIQAIDVILDHLDNHLIKVVLGDHPDCRLCLKLIDAGKVIEEKGQWVKGLSRTVCAFGNEAYVIVPKTWIGKKVRVSLVE